jgi:hypothetical protein
MLQRVKTELGELNCVGMAANSKDAAHEFRRDSP